MSLIRNPEAGFHYDILEKIEAGIVLSGQEVKSLRRGHGSLKESFVVHENGELFLVRMYLPPYQPTNNAGGYDPYQKRKLLLSRKELSRFIQEKQAAGLTLIPISLYTKGRLIKVELALARGKNKHDKRETLKARDAEREIRRALKS